MVNSYSGGEEVAFTDVSGNSGMIAAQKNNISEVLLVVWLCEIGALVLLVGGVGLYRHFHKKVDKKAGELPETFES